MTATEVLRAMAVAISVIALIAALCRAKSDVTGWMWNLVAVLLWVSIWVEE